MTRLEMYLTQTTRLNLMRQWDEDKIRSITRRYIEDRTGLFTRDILLFDCPTNAPGPVITIVEPVGIDFSMSLTRWLIYDKIGTSYNYTSKERTRPMF